MEELTLRDIIAIFDRRKKIFFITSSALFFFAMAFVMSWSNYRSTATVQIEQSFVSTNVTNPISNPNEAIEQLADQRINQIQQKVTSVESLSQIINKFSLYPNEVENTPIAILTSKMRKKVKVEFISGNISNPAAASKQTAEQLSAIAFEVSYDYKDPVTAQKVTDELVTRFLDEDLKMRRMQAQETSAFLAAQITALEGSMAAQEKSIAEFRAKNGESGPGSLIFNQQTAANLNVTVQSLASQITSNEGTQGALRAQLALVEPYSRVIADGQLLTTPATQLKALETQYSTLTAQYGPDHPDVVKARMQIQALRAQIGSQRVNPQLDAQIADLRTNLEAAKATKGADHPDVIALQGQLKKLEASKASKGGKAKESADGKDADPDDIDDLKADADNPAYIQLASQLKTAQAQHKALVKQKEAIEEQQSKFERNIAANPQIEQEMAKLSRDYENSQLRYRELKEKKMSADMTEQLELGRKGQRLAVINPPAVPEDTQPKHLLLVLAGVVLSLIGGIGAVVVTEATNQNIYGDSHLAYVIGAMPLVVIPHILAEDEKKTATGIKPYIIAIKTIFSLLKLLFMRFVVIPFKSFQSKLSQRKSS